MKQLKVYEPEIHCEYLSVYISIYLDYSELQEVLEYASLLCKLVPGAILPDCQEFLQSTRNIFEQIEESHYGSVRNAKVGRPAYVVEEERLNFLVYSGFRVEDIAIMFGCSKRTIERRLHQYQLSTRNYSTLTYVELDLMVEQFPRCGEKKVYGRLRMQGINVQRKRIRESLHRVDPSGVHYGIRRVLSRRKYQVECPNALWHLDGFHKLIRWLIIIHGGIDGFS